MARLVLLSGPSCVGKSPLLRALRRFHKDRAASLRPLVLYNDRSPRPGEEDGVDYYFRSREFVESLRDQPGYIVLPVRGDFQALEVAQVLRVLEAGQDAFFEGNPYVAVALLGAVELARVPRISCFLSPLSRDEILYLRAQPHVDLKELIADVMRRKLLRRTQRQKGGLGEKDLADIEARCGAAYHELRYAAAFDYVLPNHDGEDSENWEAFYYPLGDARRCLEDFAAIIAGELPRYAEKWEPELLGEA
ncbi:MAG: guanylate kinase [Armatimonadota bacterium]